MCMRPNERARENYIVLTFVSCYLCNSKRLSHYGLPLLTFSKANQLWRKHLGHKLVYCNVRFDAPTPSHLSAHLLLTFLMRLHYVRNKSKALDYLFRLQLLFFKTRLPQFSFGDPEERERFVNVKTIAIQIVRKFILYNLNAKSHCNDMVPNLKNFFGRKLICFHFDTNYSAAVATNLRIISLIVNF